VEQADIEHTTPRRPREAAAWRNRLAPACTIAALLARSSAIRDTGAMARAGTDGSGEPTGPQLTSAAMTFALLGNSSRLHLARRVGLSLATTSQHLAKLRLAGIASARREGKRTFYTVDDPHVLELVEQIFSHIDTDGSLAPDPR
jgi:DNA-binding transcriptional ArsR family regulator